MALAISAALSTSLLAAVGNPLATTSEFVRVGDLGAQAVPKTAAVNWAMTTRPSRAGVASNDRAGLDRRGKRTGFSGVARTSRRTAVVFFPSFA